MSKLSKLIKYLIVCVIGIIIGHIISPNPVIIPPPVIVEGIKQDSIFRDSMNKSNDSIITKIIYLEKEYEKKAESIMSNDDSTNLMLFTRYIEDYKRTIENN